MANQTNPKFNLLTEAQVIEQLNRKANYSQWAVNNAKSPESKDKAQDELNLFASAIEIMRGNNVDRELVDSLHEGRKERKV